jgi:GTPase SAR1 family protein
MYLRGAAVAVIIFDLSNERSFQSVDAWAAGVEDSFPKCAVYFAGNKLDLPHITTLEVAEAARRRVNAVKYFEMSAVTGQWVLDMFDSIAHDIDFEPMLMEQVQRAVAVDLFKQTLLTDRVRTLKQCHYHT